MSVKRSKIVDSSKDSSTSESDSEDGRFHLKRQKRDGDMGDAANHIYKQNYTQVFKQEGSSSNELGSSESDSEEDEVSLEQKKTYTSGSNEQAGSSSFQTMQKLGNYSDVAGKLMKKMGYTAGSGLGKEGQGRVDIVPASSQRGRRGLGLIIKAENAEVVVDWSDEKPPSAKETVEWMPLYEGGIPEDLTDWASEGKKKLTIDDEDTFCDRELLQTLLQCKSIFDDLEGIELRKARLRSNPYELIRGAIFLNRAAMKMANMDHCFGNMFTSPRNLGPNQLLYFADVCAGPGGFSEYVLWRRKWRAKGFGFTLRGENDFKLSKFFAADSELFEPHYGVGGAQGTGDIMKGENMEEFQRFVLDNTDNQGVHFVMADGGFSVEGQENIQEILTKQLLLCQFACALSILRQNGCFVCKTFDLFTPFSVGLVYLLRIAFKRVAIFKPVTSRPANSERYVVCEGYRDPDRRICEYLLDVNENLNDDDMKRSGMDVTEVVPFEILNDDSDFMKYMKESNERLADQQCKALAKIHDFTKNSDLMETTQAEIRDQCLKLWGVPNKVRTAPPKSDAASRFKQLTGLDDPLSLLANEPPRLRSENLNMLERIYNYKCYVAGARSQIIISLGGSHVFTWNVHKHGWSYLTDMKCSIPRNTILEVEIVDELRGEGKGQRRSPAIHVVDALVLAGEDVRKLNVSQRAECISTFVKAISKPTRTFLNVIRAKKIYRFEEVERIFERLSMKAIKPKVNYPRVCYAIPDTEVCFVPERISFIKTTKDPWSMAFSRSANKKYFYNEQTRQSSFDCPPDSSAPYELCASHRVHWWWSDQVKVHPDQTTHIQGLVSSEQLMHFVRSHVAN